MRMQMPRNPIQTLPKPALPERDEEMEAITVDTVSETYKERFIGLSEVIPGKLRKALNFAIIKAPVGIAKFSWSAGNNVLWYGSIGMLIGTFPNEIFAMMAGEAKREQLKMTQSLMGVTN